MPESDQENESTFLDEPFEIRYSRMNMPSPEERMAAALEYIARQMWHIRRDLAGHGTNLASVRDHVEALTKKR